MRLSRPLAVMLLVGSSMLMGCISDAAPPIMKEPPIPMETRLAEARKNFGDHYAKRMETFLKEAGQHEPGCIVFVGDSITEGFPLQELFAGQPVVNRGIGGDRVLGVINRVDVSAEELKPSKIHLLIGINDVLWGQDTSLGEFENRYVELLRRLRGAAPDAVLTTYSLMPMTDPFAARNADAARYNEIIERQAKKHGLKYVDLAPVLADEAGELRPDYTNDGLHLVFDGYLAWTAAILSETEFVKQWPVLSKAWHKHHSQEYTATKVNPTLVGTEFGGNRGEDEFVVYTPAYGRPTTGTNTWGREAVVVGGKVVSIGAGDSAIPADGFVLSGHGKAAAWIAMHLQVGRTVELAEGGVVRWADAVEVDTPKTPLQRVTAVQHELFRTLKAEPGTLTKDEAREQERTLQLLHRAIRKGAAVDEALVVELEERAATNALQSESAP